MEKGLQIRISDERCSVCGQPIRYGRIPMIGREFRLNCKCEEELLEKERRELIAVGEAAIRAEMRNTSGIPKKYRTAMLEDLTPVKGQDKACEAARAFVERFMENRHTNGIYFIGGVGSGKTYLSAAIANTVICRWHIPKWEAERVANGNPVRSFSVRFTSAVDLFEKLKGAYSKGNSGEDITGEYKNVPLLVLDDLGAEKTTDWTRERLFEIIDYRYNEELPIIITTNLKPDDMLSDLGERICDRIREMCVFAPVTSVSQRHNGNE